MRLTLFRPFVHRAVLVSGPVPLERLLFFCSRRALSQAFVLVVFCYRHTVGPLSLLVVSLLGPFLGPSSTHVLFLVVLFILLLRMAHSSVLSASFLALFYASFYQVLPLSGFVLVNIS